MNIQNTKIEGLLIIEPDVFGDKRGFFMESYNKIRYKDAGIEEQFVQDNISNSAKGVLRGLHFQKPPFAQGKLVQVIRGAVLDVAVDLRGGSKTYGEYESVELSGENKKQFWITAGFAHGYITIEDDTLFTYKCTNYYAPEHESGIIWNDPDIGVEWNLEKYGIEKPIISEKDLKNGTFKELQNEFA
jgi:dTDP-4-dehydrorhamnose 3,5-epimerase